MIILVIGKAPPTYILYLVFFFGGGGNNYLFSDIKMVPLKK